MDELKILCHLCKGNCIICSIDMYVHQQMHKIGNVMKVSAKTIQNAYLLQDIQGMQSSSPRAISP